MQKKTKDVPLKYSWKEKDQANYQKPAIIYEGFISIRAGSPVQPGFFRDDPPAPFEGPRS